MSAVTSEVVDPRQLAVKASVVGRWVMVGFFQVVARSGRRLANGWGSGPDGGLLELGDETEELALFAGGERIGHHVAFAGVEGR
jgi:hypothetical protein